MFLQLRHCLSMERRCTGLLWSSLPISGIFKEAKENEVAHCHWSKEYVTQEILNSIPIFQLFSADQEDFSPILRDVKLECTNSEAGCTEPREHEGCGAG